MIDIILGLFGIFYILGNLGFCFTITMNIDDENLKTGSLIALKDFIQNLFFGRNIFGIILSIIIFVVAIPAILLVLLVQIIFWIIYLISFVWNLGIKKK